jgi:hypothetical protein
MKVRLTPVAIALFSLLALVGCKKDDPAPLEAEVRGKLLAGEKDASKNWRLIGVTVSTPSTPAQSRTLFGCFADNVYTFSNNASQDYQSAEGASKCGTNSPDIIEKGNWTFTIDGLIVNIAVDETYSTLGLFSSELVFDTDDAGNTTVDNIGYPYPASVVNLTETGLTLEMNRTVGTDKLKYTLTFTAI